MKLTFYFVYRNFELCKELDNKITFHLWVCIIIAIENPTEAKTTEKPPLKRNREKSSPDIIVPGAPDLWSNPAKTLARELVALCPNFGALLNAICARNRAESSPGNRALFN